MRSCHYYGAFMRVGWGSGGGGRGGFLTVFSEIYGEHFVLFFLIDSLNPNLKIGPGKEGVLPRAECSFYEAILHVEKSEETLSKVGGTAKGRG